MALVNVSIVPSVLSLSIRSHKLETHSRLWVNSSVILNKNRNIQRKLRSAINYVGVFENVIEYEIYIHKSKDDQILLIASGRLGFAFVSLRHVLMRSSPTRAYYLNLSRHHELALIFNINQTTNLDLDELIKMIKMNRESKEKLFNTNLCINVYSPVVNEERTSTNINGDFVYFELFIDGLLRISYDQTSRDKFFNLCRKEYQDNDEQLSKIKECEELYDPERAIHYYSRYKFLYDILNKALRVHNINFLFSSGFFIQDISKQLKELQRKQNQKIVRAYRGQYMSKQELNVLKESKGRFISIKSFLSTSLDREVSCAFIPDKHENLCRVLFEITINPHSSYGVKPFANITSQSQFKDEQEILFMIGTIFRLVGIRQENEITVIQMELCNENYDRDVELLLEHMQMENDKYHECFSFGHVLRTAEMYDLAEKFYNRILKEMENDHPLIAELLGSIGLVKKAKGELEDSFKCLNKSLKKYEQMGDRTGIAKCLQNIANIHQMKGEYDQAIDKYTQALNIFHRLAGNHIELIAKCFLNIGTAYANQKKFAEACQHYTTALVMRKTILPYMHPQIATTINNIGNVYYHHQEYDNALRYFERASDIFNISLLSDRSSIAQTYYNMALIYLEKGDPKRSLSLLNRAASIYHNTLSPNHSEVHRCADTINVIKQQYNI